MSDANKTKTWRVMIYLSGDNNLSEEMIWALKELYRVGIGNNCHVAAQFDPSATNMEPRCYDLDKLNKLAATSCDVDGILDLESLRQTLDTQTNPTLENFADPTVLAGFLNKFLGKPPTDHCMLILSGHGGGALGGLLEDRNPWGRLTLRSLGTVLNAARDSRPNNKIDILGLDSCTMSMIEVAHQVKGSVDYLVGAEGFVQTAGWPYHRLLESLRRGMEPEPLARELVDNYFRYYSDYLAADISTDQAVIHIGASRRWEKLIDNLKRLSALLYERLGEKKEEMDHTVRNALVLAHWEAQSFNNEQNVDIYDFCERLSYYLPKRPYRTIHEYCKSITDRKNWNRIVLNSRNSGPKYQFAHGLSVYFPWSEIAVDYRNLEFAKDTGWYDFLKRYVDRTCRDFPPRDRDSAKDLQSGRRISGEHFTGVGGYPVYMAGEQHSLKAGGWSGTKAGGWSGTKAGGWSGTKAGGWSGTKAGGWSGTKGGGWSGAKYGSLSAEEMVQLSCMKNFPVHFYPPKPLAPKDVQAEIYKKNDEIISNIVPSSEKHTGVLLDVLEKLSEETKKRIVERLTKQKPPK